MANKKKAPRQFTEQDRDDFIHGYITAGLWSTLDNGDTPLEVNYSTFDFHQTALDAIDRDCDRFMADNAGDLNKYCATVDAYEDTPMGYAGNDFWLARHGYGTGYLDRSGIPSQLGKRLAEACKRMGENSLYVGDDGKLYVEKE